MRSSMQFPTRNFQPSLKMYQKNIREETKGDKMFLPKDKTCEHISTSQSNDTVT